MKATTQSARPAEGRAEIRRGETLVSLVVPVTERPEPLVPLYEEFSPALRKAGFAFEFVFIVEPSFWGLAEPLGALAARGEPVRILKVGQALGETALLRLAASRCKGSIVVTLPSYPRVEAEAIPKLVAAVEGGADVAVARRWPRNDTRFNQLQTRVFHAFLRRLVGGELSDVACGVRAVRRDVLEGIDLYGDFVRFLPVLALRDGYRVEEISAPQHAGDKRTRVYDPGTYLRRSIDLLGLFFLVHFTERPLRFFGLIGSALSTTGFVILAVLLWQRLTNSGIADRPLLLLGALLVVLGVQAIALGLIGEIVVQFRADHRPRYQVLEVSGESKLSRDEPSRLSDSAANP